MKHKRRKFLALILLVTFAIGLLPVNVRAETVIVNKPFDAIETITQVNPLYADVVSETDLVRPSEESLTAPNATSAADYLTTYEAAGEELREGLKQRQETITVYYQSSSLDPSTDVSSIFAASLEHTGVPTEGDYLAWVWKGYDLTGSTYYLQNGVYYFTYRYTMTYHSTAAQEAELDTKIAELLAELNPTGSDYEKLCTVYDYICANITYDYDSEGTLKHTAYAALVNGTAVCQGYATLLYRLALEMGIDCRLISGIGNGGAHGWNIVELNDRYYNVDSTWDATWMQAVGYYNYFLQCEDTFTEGGTDHIRDAEYDTAAFHTAYPMSKTDYDPDSETETDPTDPTDPSEPEGIGGTTGSVNWKLDEETGVLTIYGAGEIPNYSNYTAQPWYAYLDQITSVVIEEGITRIGMRAFYGHTSLENVSLPDSLLTVGAESFQNCTALTEIHFPDAVTEISAYALRDCTALTAVTLPENISTIYAFTFAGCTSLTAVEIPSGVTNIQNSVFEGCTALTEITIPANVTEIGTQAFADSGLQTIHFQGDPPSMSDHTSYGTFLNVTAVAFYPADNANWTEEYTLDYGGNIGWGPEGSNPSPRPEPIPCEDDITGALTAYVDWCLCPDTGVLHIYGNGAMPNLSSSTSQPWYDYLEQITSVVIYEGVTTIGQYAFVGHNLVASVTLPQGLLTVGSYAFEDCVAIQQLHFPDTVTEISSAAMQGCTGLESATLPDGLDTIYAFTFADCTSLANLEIPESVTKIMNSAFEGCSALTEITIPANVASVGDNAFTNAGLHTVIFQGNPPEMLEHSSYGPFVGVEATAYYPAGNETWTEEVMQNYGGTITWEAYSTVTEVTSGTCGTNLTWTLDSEGTLTVSGIGKMDDYTSSSLTPWGDYTSDITAVVLLDGISRIGNHAFGICSNLTSVTISESVLEIGVQAFSYCRNLVTVRIPGSVTSIGVSAFDNCYKLESIVMDNGVTNIDMYAFTQCPVLNSVTLPNSLVNISYNAFQLCENLTNITIPESVELISGGAFSYSGLTEITFIGNAPVFGVEAEWPGVFAGVTAKAYYPAGNETWTEEVMQNYGGTITWVPYESEPAYTVTYTSASISLAGDIGVNYYAQLSDDIVADEGAYMQFTVAGENQIVPLGEAEVSTNAEGVTTYRFSCKVAAKQMTETITGQMYLSDGTAVGEAKEYSVKAYCDAAIPVYGQYEAYASLVGLMEAMLNYGAYSQISFGYNTDAPANGDLEDTSLPALTEADVSAYAHGAEGSEDGISVSSVSLLLESTTTIRFYFTLEEGYDISSYTFLVDGVETTPVQSEENVYYVDKVNVAAKDLDKMATVTVGGLTVKYCGLSYVRQVAVLYASYYSESLVNVAKALYAYNLAANAYFG